MKFFVSILIFLFLPLSLSAQERFVIDQYGIDDKDENRVYSTDPYSKDTDGDGFSDWIELNSGFSPHNPVKVRLDDNDQDKDGLNDRLELKFGTDIMDEDSDKDGYKDGEEVDNGFDPLSQGKVKLDKRIEIDLKNQKLSYVLGKVRMGTFTVSSGKPGTPTPKGEFKVLNKHPKAWSKYGLWMPYWIGLGTGKFGIHELPVWPNGYREGENHLGKPVSHGCIRLGVGAAKFIYDWTPVGIPVSIY